VLKEKEQCVDAFGVMAEEMWEVLEELQNGMNGPVM
jgi:hypothetical protein